MNTCVWAAGCFKQHSSMDCCLGGLARREETQPTASTVPHVPYHTVLCCVVLCRQLTASGAGGDKMSVSVCVTHPTLGSYFDAHLLLRQCPADQQCPAEVAGLATLWR